MKVEIFALCDAATDQGGRLNILGAFDMVGAPLPMALPQCSIALRLRYSIHEHGNHMLGLIFENNDGIPLVPKLESHIDIPVPPSDRTSNAMNLVLNMQRLKLEHEGEYHIRLRMDDEELAQIPFWVRDMTPKEPNPLK